MARIAVAALAAILAMSTGAPAVAQAPSDEGSFVALCETNASDEVTRYQCLHLAATILSSAKATTPWGQFETGFAEVIDRYSSPVVRDGADVNVRFIAEHPLELLCSGRWTPFDPESGRTLDLAKRTQARRARVVAGMTAEDLREFLLMVTPEDCYAELHGAAWGVAVAWDYGLASTGRTLTPALEEWARVSSVTYCGPPSYHIDVVPPSTMG